MTTIEEFTEMVNSHDICYDYTDDHLAWKKGFNERIAIDKARKELGDEICVPIWNEAVDGIFSKEERSRFYWEKETENGSNV